MPLNTNVPEKTGALTCTSVYLFTGRDECCACNKATRLFEFMVLPPFETIGDQEEAMDDQGSMLKEMVVVPGSLKPIVAEQSNGKWREDYSKTADETYWMNHCEWCDTKQGDFFVQGAQGSRFSEGESARFTFSTGWAHLAYLTRSP